MAKIPFDIKYKPQIESGEYKVVAHEHEEQEVRIVCWDNKGEYPIVALVDSEPEKFDRYGRVPGGNRGGEFSLFLVTPEEELTPFEKELVEILKCLSGRPSEQTYEDYAKEQTAELLALAREQFIRDGYVIEKKAFHDAVEKVDPEVMKEVSDNVDKENELTEFEERIFKLLRQYKECDIPLTPENIKAEASMLWPDLEKYFFDLYGKEGEGDSALRSFYYRGLADGKAAAMKDLPRWEKPEGWITNCYTCTLGRNGDGRFGLFMHCGFIPTTELEKLPRKED